MSQVMNHKDSSEYPVSILYPTDPVWVIHGHARWAGLGADVAWRAELKRSPDVMTNLDGTL